MKRRYKGNPQIADKVQNIFSRLASEYAIFVFNYKQLDIGAADGLRRPDIAFPVVLQDLHNDSTAVAVSVVAYGDHLRFLHQYILVKSVDKILRKGCDAAFSGRVSA